MGNKITQIMKDYKVGYYMELLNPVWYGPYLKLDSSLLGELQIYNDDIIKVTRLKYDMTQYITVFYDRYVMMYPWKTLYNLGFKLLVLAIQNEYYQNKYIPFILIACSAIDLFYIGTLIFRHNSLSVSFYSHYQFVSKINKLNFRGGDSGEGDNN